MEAAKVRPYQGSNFLVLASSAVLFDLITDKRVKEFMKYESTGRAYSNDMVIDLFSLAFKKAKTIKTDNTYVDGDGYTCYIYHDAVANKNYIFVGAPKGVNDDTKVLVANLTTNAMETETKDSAVTSANLEALNVHYSFVLGEECLFRIGVEGHTQPQFIKKELGSAGTEDPLNQRQSIGWKIDSIGYKVPNPDAVVAYLSCPTQYKVNVNARPDVKNQFTDYKYGYMDNNNNYFYPEQVFQSIGTDGNSHYYVKGTNIEVHSVTMTNLVKPINGGRYVDVDAAKKIGKKAIVVGSTPTASYILKTSQNSGTPIRFTADQVVKGTGADEGKFYINGLEPSAATEVVALPATFELDNVPKADGTGYDDNVKAVEYGVSAHNLTGDPSIDNV
jgi:hypothetical protein